MAEPGITRPLTGWQRANVLAAAQYVRELILRTPGDARARTIYDGLLEVLEPSRRTVRQQREMAAAAKAAAQTGEQRRRRERRAADRRRRDVGPPGGVERRRADRRGRDRRKA